jgi:acyl carrier protein
VTRNAKKTVRPMPEWNVERLTELVFEIVRDQLLTAADGLTPQSNLIDAGLDSIRVTQLMLAIEEHTGVWVDESLLTPELLASSETLAACVHEQLHGHV